MTRCPKVAEKLFVEGGAPGFPHKVWAETGLFQKVAVWALNCHPGGCYVTHRRLRVWQVTEIVEAVKVLTGVGGVAVAHLRTEIDFLEGTLADPLGAAPIAVRDRTHLPLPHAKAGKVSISSPQRACNAQSMVPNDARKSQQLRVTQAVQRTLRVHRRLYAEMWYPEVWREPTFRGWCLKWGPPADSRGGRDVLMGLRIRQLLHIVRAALPSAFPASFQPDHPQAQPCPMTGGDKCSRGNCPICRPIDCGP